MRSHSVTCHPAKVTFPPLPQPKLVLDSATPEGCKAELTWVVVISHDSLPAKYGHLSQKYPGSVMAGIRTCDRESQVQRPNHYTTEPPSQQLEQSYWSADILCRRFFLLCSDFDSRFAHTRIIREHYVFLVDHLDAKHSGLVGELYQAEVLSKEERDIINAEVISFTQNEKLLSMLSRKTKDQFDKFLDALENTGQQHVRNHVTGRQGQFFVVNV